MAHEHVALCMAHGYYMLTGRPQAVMVHVSVGTANALNGIMNASRDRVPVLFTSGRTPLFEAGRFGARTSYIHWAQEMYDQASMLREFVKWDYELRDGLNVEAVVDRALSLALSPPRGPVYLTLPREVLAQESVPEGRAQPQAMAVASEPHPDPAAVARAAELLAAARQPLVVAIGSGQDPQSVPLLVELAGRFALPVLEHRARFVCLPGGHPMHLGFDWLPYADEADAILLLEADVPWIPMLERPSAEARLIHVGVDPLFSRYPLRTFGADLAITSSVRAFLPALGAALDERLAGQAQRIERRRARIASEVRAVRERWQAERAADERAGPITKLWLNRCLAAVKPADAIVVNEYWAERKHLIFDQPGTYFQYPPVGALGWGLPAALGAQQALPERTVIACVGDGAYLFANPAACHQVAAALQLPVLTIVCNNRRWEAVEGATWRLYPEGAARQAGQAPLSSLEPSPKYEQYVQASGGYGERVDERAALPAALERALKVVRVERRQALLNVMCA